MYHSRIKHHTGQYSLFQAQEKFKIQNNSPLESSSISIFMFGSYYSIGRRAVGSHGWQLKQEKWKFLRTGFPLLYIQSTSMNWSNTRRYSEHLSYLSSPTDNVVQVLLMLPISLTLKQPFLSQLDHATPGKKQMYTLCAYVDTDWRVCLNTSSIQI